MSTLIILGSGWNRALSLAQITKRIPYAEIFGKGTSVPGHAGELVYGLLAGKEVVFMSGRFHLYEVYSGVDATSPIKFLANEGVERMIVTSASGALNPEYEVGDFVILSDLLTIFLKSNPLIGPEFIDMSSVFDQKWRDQAIKASQKLKLSYREGIYAYMSGPHYESPADKRALRILGADCVGMSTVPEVLVAKQLGLDILGLSFITNLAFVKHDHHDVVAAAENSAAKMAELLAKVI